MSTKTKKEKFYAVFRGHGNTNRVFDSWDEAEPWITGAPGCKHESFPSRAEAQDWLDRKIAATPKVAVDYEGGVLVIDPESTDPDMLDRLQASGSVLLSDRAKKALNQVFKPEPDDVDGHEAE